MKARYKPDAPRRSVNLVLNEELVMQARELTDNLSGVVESLLLDFVEHERRKRVLKIKSLKVTMATWNEFNEKFGSFADEYSTL